MQTVYVFVSTLILALQSLSNKAYTNQKFVPSFSPLVLHAVQTEPGRIWMLGNIASTQMISTISYEINRPMVFNHVYWIARIVCLRVIEGITHFKDVVTDWNCLFRCLYPALYLHENLGIYSREIQSRRKEKSWSELNAIENSRGFCS